MLCRLALGSHSIDAVSFSGIRLSAGALMLVLIMAVRKRVRLTGGGGSWGSAAMLLLYALAFSLAYLDLDTATGALILFGAVQVSMIAIGWAKGERPRSLEWVGLIIAVAGLLYLVSPGLTAPSPKGAFLMTLAGMAWGVYSLRGRAVPDAAAATADNFVRSVPLMLLVGLPFLSGITATPEGILWAVISGAVTSGLGYVLWYAALKGLTATRAAVVQLSVPVLAALGGVLLLSEELTVRLLLTGAITLGGVGVAVAGRTG